MITFAMSKKILIFCLKLFKTNHISDITSQVAYLRHNNREKAEFTCIIFSSFT